MNALLIDFGSTFTKLRAVALDPVRILGSCQGPSTVTSDVSGGLNAALEGCWLYLRRPRALSREGERVEDLV